MKSQHKISAHSDNFYFLTPDVTNLIQLVTWGVTNRDVLLLATIRYFRIPSSKCFKILERDFLQMGPAASGPDLAKTQSTTAQNDFHTAHNALMSLGEFDLTLNTGYFSFFVPTATCCC